MSIQTNQTINQVSMQTVTLTKMDGQQLKKLTESALTWLRTNQQTVNSLNVFPVPDGDTGTNMVLTMQAAFNEIAQSGEKNVGKLAHAIAQGALMGARGNSGVILSQLWRGFARVLDNLDTVDSQLLSKAFQEACNTAYKGVVRPVEGTILTVAKDIAKTAAETASRTVDLVEILESVVTAADTSVKYTPELLPILKQAGVVDSGGKGLFFILEGMLRHIKGQSLEVPITSVQPLSVMIQDNHLEESIEPGQDFEVVVDFQPREELDLDRFYNQLSDFGTSIQVGEGDGMYRMHIHVPTEKRYFPIDYAMSLGTVTKVSIENLIAQMQNPNAAEETRVSCAPVEPGQIAVVTVTPGNGLARIFASMGAAAIVSGGDTMNPSTEEILKAFENLPTDTIIILPNNKNIVLTAQAAASVTVKKVRVIPSQNIPQGLSAILHLSPDGDLDAIAEEMTNALNDVEAAEITVATRSVEINGVHVNKGEIITLLNGKLVYSASSLEEACLGVLAKAKTDDRERITIFYGQDINKNEVNAITDKIRSVYPRQEIEILEGGQPNYPFIISIE